VSDEVKNRASQILEAINSSRNILLHFHPSPDADSMGSTLALSFYLKSLGKAVTVISGDSPVPREALSLPGIDTVTQKNYFEINPSDFDLFLILDSSSPDQISKLQPVTFPPGMKTVVIDHHISNASFGNINLIDAEAPAAGQVVYELLVSWQAEITHDIALCLLMAIHSDTGGFSYPGTTSATFSAAEHLAKIAPDFTDHVFYYSNQNDPKKVLFEGIALTSVKLYFGSRVAISQVTHSQLSVNDIQKSQIEKAEISNILKSVVGWDMGISFVEREPGIISVSFRTRLPDQFDLSKIAIMTGSGGGHKSAAGATIRMPFEEGLAFLLGKIKEAYPVLGEP